MIENIRKQIESIIESPAAIEVNFSEKEEFGHYSSNVAFKLAPTSKASSGLARTPFEVAKDLAEKLSANKEFAKVEAVAPGFINFWLAPKLLQKSVARILKEKNSFGRLKTGKVQKINVEFVSANPTGPLTMANGRGGFYGDALANVLEAAGQNVTREYYVNDAGNQIRLLGESILAEFGIVEKKPEHYQGNYIKDYAKSIKDELDKIKKVKIGKSNIKLVLMGGIQWEFREGKYEPLLPVDSEQVGRVAVYLEQDPMKNGRESFMDKIRKSLEGAGIKFDSWFSEYKNLHKKRELKKTLEFLEKRSLVEDKEGARWLGEGVLIKSDGNPTYFLADLAYHYDKLIKRKFDLAIDIWGADHHGYAARMKKGVEALGIKGDRLKILMTQLVRLVSRGKEVRMSKRKGEFVTMDDLLKEVGADAARFFFLMHSLDTHMDFDLDLAKERSRKNPVYYAQYAYVRAGNILQKAGSVPAAKNLNALKSDSEIRLMLELIKLPDVIRQTACDYQVHRLAKYADDIARAFHNFYEKERVLNVENEDLKRARLSLVLAAKIVLENLFGIIGISKPKKM